MEYLIRNFQEDDIIKLVDLCSEHAAFEQAPYVQEGKHLLLKSQLLSPTPALYCWVVVMHTELVGYVTYTFDYSTWDANFFLHVDCIYLREQCRGVGIGSDLMRRLANVAREKGCVNMQWQTPTFNSNAIKFYQRIGAQGLNKMRFFLDIRF
jgi:GNAT superfamily N-acetyltransferase